VINSLPFTISAPGTYVLTNDLSALQASPAITIPATVTGPVIVDLNGHTITGLTPTGAGTLGIVIGFDFGPTGNAYPITVRNGTLTNFNEALRTQDAAPLSDITIQNIIFNNDQTGIQFSQTGFSSISGCKFNGVTYGIYDYLSPGGNSYTNCTFTNSPPNTLSTPLTINGLQNGGVPTNLISCQFGAPK
jgi:hypothetical protein